MKLKKFKVILKSGMSHPTLFDTVGEAVKTVGVKNISKLEEVEDPKAKGKPNVMVGDEMLVISKRSNEDLVSH